MNSIGLYRKNKGRWGEARAAMYLKTLGFEIVEMNYNCRAGEIDIIAEKGNELHFVEVKARRDCSCGHPLEAITKSKLRHVIQAAQYYIHVNDLYDRDISIDGIGIIGDSIELVEGINV